MPTPKPDLKTQLATKAGENPQNLPATPPPKTMAQFLRDIAPQLQRALPKGFEADRFTRLALTALRQTPKLAACSRDSFLGSLMQAAVVGLEPNTPTGQCYLIPYKGEAQLQLGYKGMLELVRRSGEVIGTPSARLVYENDLFDLSYGYEEDTLVHIPWFLRKDKKFDKPGDILCGYLRVRYVKGGADLYPMPMAEIKERRERSPASESGPWVTDFEAMALKTVVRRFFNWLPMRTEERAQVLEMEGKVAIANVGADDIDIDFIDVTPEPEPARAPSTEGRKIVCPHTKEIMYEDYCRNNCKQNADCAPLKEAA